MRKFVFGLALVSALACTAFGDKEVNPEKEKVTVPAQVADLGYKYLSNFPAKDVLPLMKALEDEVNPQINAKKEKVSVSKEYMQAVLNLLMKDERVQLTIALQNAMQPPPPPPPPPTPAPEAPKKEEKK